MPDKLPPRSDVLVARRAADAWGVLSLDEVFACGLSRGAVSDRVLNGRLHPIHRGVYAVGHANLPLQGRFLAAVKACGPTAVLSHHSAAALWGFVQWDDRYPEVTVFGAWSCRHPRLRIHRTTTLDLDDKSRHHAIPVTSPARTLLDLAARLDHRPLRAATRRAQSLHRVNVRQLADVLARHRRRRGSARLARVVATGPRPPGVSSRTRRSTSCSGAGSPTPTSTSRSGSAGAASSPTFAGRRSAWSSRPTAPHSTTTSSPARTTPSARRCSRPTASACCASRGSR
jgi:hypothetical protein